MINSSKKEKQFIFIAIFVISLIGFSLVKAACSDDIDGGRVYEKQGTCTDYSGSYVDYCTMGDTGNGLMEGYLSEYWCESEYCNRQDLISCPCGCVGGACRSCNLFCDDSQDGGDKPCIGGICKDRTEINGSWSNHADTCNGNNVIEYYCNNGVCTAKSYSNYVGCAITMDEGLGECVTQSCTDYDQGENYNVSSYCVDWVGGQSNPYYDYCSCSVENPTYAHDFVCENNHCEDEAIYCPTCVNGICDVQQFDFSITANPPSGIVSPGNSISTSINLGLISGGDTQSITVAASASWPQGLSVFWPSGQSCSPSPNCSLPMTINVAANTDPVTLDIIITGTATGGKTHYTSYRVNVLASGAQINPPVVTTNDAEPIAETTATLRGTLESLGGADRCLVWFKWGLTTALENETPIQTTISPNTFSAELSDLDPNTTYYFKAFAKNFGSW